MDKYQEVINQLIELKPQALIVFGSYAWGEPDEDSDLDILMIKDDIQGNNMATRCANLGKRIHHSLPLDIFILTRDELQKNRKRIFLNHIVKNGKVIYGRLT